MHACASREKRKQVDFVIAASGENANRERYVLWGLNPGGIYIKWAIIVLV